MKRLAPIFLILGLALATTSCAATTLPADALGHDVFITLKKSDASSIAGLTQDCRKLREIPGILRLDAGPRAAAMTSEFNDPTFHVGLHVVFSSGTAHDRYVDHPIHKALLKRWKAEIAQIRVFDYHLGGGLAY